MACTGRRNPLKPAIKMRRALAKLASSEALMAYLAFARWQSATRELAAAEKKMATAVAHSQRRVLTAALADWNAAAVVSKQARELLRLAGHHDRRAKRKQALSTWRKKASASAMAARKAASAGVHYRHRLGRAVFQRWRTLAAAALERKALACAMGTRVSLTNDFSNELSPQSHSSPPPPTPPTPSTPPDRSQSNPLQCTTLPLCLAHALCRNRALSQTGIRRNFSGMALALRHSTCEERSGRLGRPRGSCGARRG